MNCKKFKRWWKAHSAQERKRTLKCIQDFPVLDTFSNTSICSQHRYKLNTTTKPHNTARYSEIKYKSYLRLLKKLKDKALKSQDHIYINHVFPDL